jgi:flavin reductase ActVB
MPLDADGFRQVMGWLAAGVSVVTTVDRAGRPWGLTATAVCSVSLDPPLTLVCIDRGADCHQAFLEAEAFAVNLLRDTQQELSHHFAKKDALKFEGILYRPGVTGVPILADGLANLECRIRVRHPGGDHTIVIGEAVHSVVPSSEDSGSPLVHFRGGYVRLGGRLAPDPS